MHLIGPQWRPEIDSGFGRNDARLEDLTESELRRSGLEDLELDLLVVGHEYPSLPAWRKTRALLGCDVATFQHDPNFVHLPDAFDAASTRLYCCSPEMAKRYRQHRPRLDLSVQIGLGEDPQPAVTGGDLLWLGRICEAKATHLAVRAAGLLGRRIRIVGPIHEPEYVRRHAKAFDADHVDWVGELGGEAKAAEIRRAGALVYTSDPAYVEAGAGVFADALRAGTPVAAVAWRSGTCPEVSLCDSTGSIATVDPRDGDEAAVSALATAIDTAVRLDPATVQRIGLRRFDPVRHFAALAGLDRPSGAA